ncbi:hypothetical protein PR048_018869 [Dryococelus australis]|uniref:Uncharacterized protein n=1 Tax=Dryococelus australis TaxID=614101 RepID=A0ABQ9H202_9NEOP|nr:hypothetical protein PR048_018869 [Dryococelus australis]
MPAREKQGTKLGESFVDEGRRERIQIRRSISAEGGDRGVEELKRVGEGKKKKKECRMTLESVGSENGAVPECKGGRSGDVGENPLTSGIVRHNSHMLKSGGDPECNRARHSFIITRSADLPWRSRLVPHRSGAREALRFESRTPLPVLRWPISDMFNIFGLVYWLAEGISETVFRKVLLPSRSCPGSMFEGVIRQDVQLRPVHFITAHIDEHAAPPPLAVGKNARHKYSSHKKIWRLQHLELANEFGTEQFCFVRELVLLAGDPHKRDLAIEPLLPHLIYFYPLSQGDPHKRDLAIEPLLSHLIYFYPLSQGDPHKRDLAIEPLLSHLIYFYPLSQGDPHKRALAIESLQPHLLYFYPLSQGDPHKRALATEPLLPHLGLLWPLGHCDPT